MTTKAKSFFLTSEYKYSGVPVGFICQILPHFMLSTQVSFKT